MTTREGTNERAVVLPRLFEERPVLLVQPARSSADLWASICRHSLACALVAVGVQTARTPTSHPPAPAAKKAVKVTCRQRSEWKRRLFAAVFLSKRPAFALIDREKSARVPLVAIAAFFSHIDTNCAKKTGQNRWTNTGIRRAPALRKSGEEFRTVSFCSSVCSGACSIDKRPLLSLQLIQRNTRTVYNRLLAFTSTTLAAMLPRGHVLFFLSASVCGLLIKASDLPFNSARTAATIVCPKIAV